MFVILSGFSTVALVEDNLTRKKFALKKIICHSLEDQRLAQREIEYHSILKHPNVIELVDSDYLGTPDPVANATSQVLLILPYYHVSMNILKLVFIHYTYYINKQFFVQERNISSRVRKKS